MNTTQFFKTTASGLGVCLLAFAAPTASLASIGSADPVVESLQIVLPGDDVGHDQFARRGRGADDPAGHVRGGGKGRGKDDAPNHG